jgi:hypothetical protein
MWNCTHKKDLVQAMKHFNPHGYEICVFELQRALDVNKTHAHILNAIDIQQFC